MQLVTKDTNTSIEVRDDIFDYHFNEGLVHQAVVAFMNGARSGNSAQKTRAEVRGGGRKPWRQKGTGRARAGTIRSPIWRSGGVTFASKPRSYEQKLPKKMYRRAIRSIISELARSGTLHVVSSFTCESPKTKDFLKVMNQLDISTALIITHELGMNEYLGSRNLIEFEMCDTTSINPYILLRFEHVVITEEALRALEEQLQ